MAITYYMVQLPPVLLFIVLIVLSGFLAGLATYLVRKYIVVEILRSHNEVTGFVFIAVAGFYALLLSFVVLVVWDQLNETRANVSNEGSSAMGLYRDIKYYPDAVASKQLTSVYLDFVYNVIDEEFPNMEIMKPSRKTPESLNRVYAEMENLKPRTPFEVQLVAEMFHHLNQLDTYRGLRTTSIETEIPPPIWLPMIFGAIITMIIAMLLDIENSRMHVIINSLLGILIAMFMFIIILLDHPFTGAIGLKPKAYKEIFTLEDWSKEKPLNNFNIR